MNYQLYRSTSLGQALQESLAEFVQSGLMAPYLADRVMMLFDRSINSFLASLPDDTLVIKPCTLRGYRFCDDVWTLVLTDVRICHKQDVIFEADKLKIVACDGKFNDFY